MQASLSHKTVYRYDVPVFLEPHVIRMRPRNDASQRLLSYQLDVAPVPRGRSAYLDPDGNVVVQVWFDNPTSELAVSSRFEVETLRSNPFDFLLPSPDRLKLPLHYLEPERSSLAGYLASTFGIGRFVRSIAAEAGGQAIPFLDILTRHLFTSFTQIERPEGEPHAPLVTLERHEGSCRDLAVLFSAACRSMGLAARFVSGYERESAFQEQAHMHAWAEVYIPGGGWRGYDPSRGAAVGTSHIAVAASATAAAAAPVTGTFRGAATAEMTFSISMQAQEAA